MDNQYKTNLDLPPPASFTHFDTANKKVVAIILTHDHVHILCDQKGYKYPQEAKCVRAALDSELIHKEVKVEVKKEVPKKNVPNFRNDLPLNNKPRNIVPNAKQKRLL